ncbi:MAG: phosphodiester glycosidase family protein [Clostridia bacterium]|nr:phosphodiester glycosidase family protein [Clostridia bacterium]
MQNDFKENYISQQKRQAEERKARLAKIGMGPAEPERAADIPARRPRPEAVSPQRRPAAQGERPAARSTPRPAEAPRQAQRPEARPQPQRPQGERPVRPESQSAVTAKGNVAPRPQNVRPRPQNAPAGAEAPARRQAAPSQAAERPVQRREGAQAIRRPTEEAPVRRPSAETGRGSSAHHSGGGRPDHYNVRKRPAPGPDELFKKEISDNDSRAMIFALTGKPERPEDGGDVDIINMGRIYPPKRSNDNSKKAPSKVGTYVGRGFAALGLALALVIVFVFSSVALIAHGPSTTIRDFLVMSAEHSSAAKWVPRLFLDGKTVDSIINRSEETVQDIISIDDYTSGDTVIDENEWANAKDGMIFETVSGSGYKAYVLLVKDPSRIFVGTSAESRPGAQSGDDIFHITEFYNAVAAINGGEFPDYGGGGTGYTPIGLTYSKGKCVHNDGYTDRTFLGITNDNTLVVNEGMTEKKADELGIRDAVSFQKGNTLIQKDGNEIVFHYQDGNTGRAQRTGIGQRADGTIILVVTDGRTASSLGATHNDMIDLMVSYGAVTAGLLDGGSSSLMYYRDYYNKYDYDYDKLDEYQKQGLVNNYKAFTEPRKIPTFFIVSAE